MEAIQRDESELIGSESPLQVGDSVIFHARSNFPLSEFHFVLYSHGQIVTSQQIKSNSGSRLVTFDAMATSEMKFTSSKSFEFEKRGCGFATINNSSINNSIVFISRGTRWQTWHLFSTSLLQHVSRICLC